MQTTIQRSDDGLMDLLRGKGPLGVTELASAMQVTATAMRQRLEPVDGRGTDRTGVGQSPARQAEPSVSIDRQGNSASRLEFRRFGDRLVARNSADQRSRRFAAVCCGGLPRRWPALTACQSPARRRPSGWKSVQQLFAERKVPFAVEQSGQLPVLDGAGLPVSGAGRAGPRDLRGRKDVVFRNVGRSGAADRMPPRWRVDVLPVSNELSAADILVGLASWELEVEKGDWHPSDQVEFVAIDSGRREGCLSRFSTDQ